MIAQVNSHSDNYVPKSLSFSDSILISNLPELEVPAFYKSANALILPTSVDNSTSPYFRPITWQTGYECGQSAGVAFVFTYEVDRLRNLYANVASNQYPTHFVWNFLNDAYNYNGVSAFDTWEIVRTCGTPNIADYGPLYSISESYWMSDYQKYYNAMKNRISGVYAIHCDTEDGLNTLKAWFYDHLEGSNTGGVAAMYAQYGGPNTTLPAGTPEGGKALMSTWGSSPSHTWTVVGFNDSIRYDYNNDGQYTNNIDINGDGIVNVRDWEIGGIKFANGYSGTGWGNNGFAYTMYKCLADGINNNGIWNSSVFVVKAKLTQDPQLTFKINLKHNLRNQVKVIVGVSQNTNAANPDVRLEYPIFNFHGGELGMQGDSTEAGKNIEFGLDITPLLSYVNAGQAAKYFLEIIEKDPGGTGSGQLNSFSLMDYTMGTNETAYSSTNIPLINNDTTRFAIVKTVVFSKLNIQNDSMSAKINDNYSHQLNAEFGTPPYKWSLKMDYNETITNTAFPTTPTQVLNTGNSGFVIQNLAFNFPFYGESFNQIYVYADGFIKFDNNAFTFPYLINKDLLLRSHKAIAPFFADLTYGTGQKVLFETDANSATIVWKASVSGETGSNVNVALKIYDSGKVEFYYGTINVTGQWTSALSGGGAVNNQYTTLSNAFTTNTTSRKMDLMPPDYPENMVFTESGLFSATPGRYYNTSIKFQATDNNNISCVRSIPFKTYGVTMDYSVVAGGDSIVNTGDTVLVSVKIKNIGAGLISNANMILLSSDTTIIMLDSNATVGNIANGDSLSINNAFSFIVKPNALDGHIIDLTGELLSPSDTFSNGFSITVKTFMLTLGNVTITDGNNNTLEPNETASMMLQVKNIGGATATNIHLDLSTSDPYVTLNPGFANIDTINPYSSKNTFFVITTAANTPSDHLIVLNAHITGSNNYSYTTFFFIQLGNVMEDFETNNFTKYDWLLGGDANWFTSDTAKYQGSYSAKSGDINDNETSWLSVKQYVLTDGNIKFHKKVSCESDNTNHNYDYFAFYIDGAEKARWDGNIDWSQETFPVTAGEHTFKWAYVKDYSVSWGSDCAWLDNIIFPLFGDATPELTFAPMVVNKTMEINTTDTAIVDLKNIGNGLVLYTNTLQLVNSLPVTWANANINAGGLNSNQNQQLIIQFDGTQLQIGNYNCQLIVNQNFLTQTVIPVNLTVENQSGIDENQIFSSACNPNPFNDKVKISVNIKEKGNISIAVYDFTGRLVNDLSKTASYDKGNYTFTWDGCNDAGNKSANGLYFCNIIINNKSVVHKLILSH